MRVLFAAFAALLLAAPGAASANVRQGAVGDVREADTPNVNGPQPHVGDISGVQASYDEGLGTLTVTATFYDRGATDVYFTLSEGRLGQQAAVDYKNDCTDFGKAPQFFGTIRLPAAYPGSRASSSGSLDGYQGSVEGQSTVAADNSAVSATFTNAQLAGRNYRCVEVSTYGMTSGYGDGSSESDASQLFFAGFEPKTLTTATALEAAELTLATKFPDRWTTDSKRYLTCPKQELLQDDDGPKALCAFNFSDGQLRRHGDLTIALSGNDFALPYFKSYAYNRRLKSCAVKDLKRERIINRSLRAGGLVGCADSSASLVRDLHRARAGTRTVGFHGTNRAGFEDQDAFKCRVSKSGARTRAKCANKLGDRFEYAFTRAPKVKPRRSGSRNGGGGRSGGSGGGSGGGGTPNVPGNRIPNYDQGKGYPVRCRDGLWSKSGGRPGACSGHGGVDD